MGPTMAIIFVLSLVSLRFFFHKELQQEQQQEQESSIHELMETNENAVIKNKSMLIKSLIVLVVAIILFSLQGITHIEVSIIAIGAAAVLLVITRAQLERILHEVDWPTLFFFVGLFVIVGVAQHAGLINVLAKVAINVTGGNPWLTFVIVIWLAGIASAFVDNIPFTTTMIPLIHSLNSNPTIASEFGDFHISPLWLALALGADLGGNGTLIGSSAGIVAAGLGEKFGHPITFNKWFKIGFPFMLITLAIGM
jgi:Na+/H+ antiporter NhaD/arsenite permease-like protein